MTATAGHGCGKEIRALGSLARQYRQAAYTRRLAWARGEGRCPREGFKGLSRELGPNPELDELQAALDNRVRALAGDPTSDPFEDVRNVMETTPLALAA